MERAMGIEPSSESPDVVEIANDKCKDLPKPSKMEEVSIQGLVDHIFVRFLSCSCTVDTISK
jgi:hypothetical protein